MYPTAYCPSCRYKLYCISRPVNGHYKFKCSCGCNFYLKQEFVKVNKIG